MQDPSFLTDRTDQTQVREEEEEERKTTGLDIQLILPTVLILILTLVFMSTVIPYAFHVVIQQLKQHHGADDNGGVAWNVIVMIRREMSFYCQAATSEISVTGQLQALLAGVEGGGGTERGGLAPGPV